MRPARSLGRRASSRWGISGVRARRTARLRRATVVISRRPPVTAARPLLPAGQGGDPARDEERRHRHAGASCCRAWDGRANGPRVAGASTSTRAETGPRVLRRRGSALRRHGRAAAGTTGRAGGCWCGAPRVSLGSRDARAVARPAHAALRRSLFSRHWASSSARSRPWKAHRRFFPRGSVRNPRRRPSAHLKIHHCGRPPSAAPLHAGRPKPRLASQRGLMPRSELPLVPFSRARCFYWPSATRRSAWHRWN